MVSDKVLLQTYEKFLTKFLYRTTTERHLYKSYKIKYWVKVAMTLNYFAKISNRYLVYTHTKIIDLIALLVLRTQRSINCLGELGCISPK